MVANPDGLSLADRVAKRQAAEAKVAAELATQEKQRLLKYDKGKLPLHKQVFDLRTGWCLDDGGVRVPTHDVRVRRGIVEVCVLEVRTVE